MYKAGDYIVYKNNGVCLIEGVRKEKFGSCEKKDYYVLKLLYTEGAVVYVPVDKEETEKRMRAPISKSEADEIIKSYPSIEESWISDDKLRVSKFKDILERGIPTELVWMLKSIEKRASELAEIGKRIRASDEAMLRKAETNLYGEIAFALNLNPSEVVKIIKNA